MGTKSDLVPIGYEELLSIVQKKITDDFGSLMGFIRSEKFTECGFVDTQTQRNNVLAFLSANNNGRERVKSFPTLKKIVFGLYGVEIESELQVIRQTTITISEKDINKLSS